MKKLNGQDLKLEIRATNDDKAWYYEELEVAQCEIKELIAVLKSDLGLNFTSVREVIEYSWDELGDIEDDFEVANHRFIREDCIDKIQQDELGCDLYILGCFNSWFIASVLGIDADVIEAMKEAEAFEAIGKLVISMDKLDELQYEYASADGYGHHFNHYDGEEIELTLLGNEYYAFRVN